MASNSLLSPKEFELLTSLLAEHETKTLDELSGAFQSAFPKQENHFVICCTLCVLLQDAAPALTASQRIAALYILFDVYQADVLQKNPFISFLIDLLADSSPSSPNERSFIASWLTPKGPPAELFKSTPRDVVWRRKQTRQGNTAHSVVTDADLSFLLPPPNATQVASLRTDWCPTTDHTQATLAPLSPFRKLGINPLLPDPQKPVPLPAVTDPTASASKVDDTEEVNPEIPPRSFEPQWVRPAPGLFEFKEDEVTWMSPRWDPDLLWDYSMCADASRGQDMRRIVADALRGSLPQPQQVKVMQQLQDDPNLVYHIGMTPKRLPLLVENNPQVAVQVLLKMMDSSQISEYLSVLVNMTMSLNSMEVVNRLASAVEVPKEYLHLYVNNCMSSCEAQADKYAQNRLVRLVCMLVQQLVKNKIINIQDILQEVESFCINFSRVREAAQLFRSLKAMERGEPPSNGPPGIAEGLSDEGFSAEPQS